MSDLSPMAQREKNRAANQQFQREMSGLTEDIAERIIARRFREQAVEAKTHDDKTVMELRETSERFASDLIYELKVKGGELHEAG